MDLKEYFTKRKELHKIVISDEFNNEFQDLIQEINDKGYNLDVWIFEGYLKVRVHDEKINHKLIKDIEETTKLKLCGVVETYNSMKLLFNENGEI